MENGRRHQTGLRRFPHLLLFRWVWRGGLHGLLSAGENSVQCSLLPLQRALHSFLVYVQNAVQCSPVGRGEDATLVPFLCVLHMWMRAVHVDVNGEQKMGSFEMDIPVQIRLFSFIS